MMYQAQVQVYPYLLISADPPTNCREKVPLFPLVGEERRGREVG